jgi:hypothetical protein
MRKRVTLNKPFFDSLSRPIHMLEDHQGSGQVIDRSAWAQQSKVPNELNSEAMPSAKACGHIRLNKRRMIKTSRTNPRPPLG